ncbi:MAG TPA: TolC family protein, partial [Fibrobacteraceae bacterium]|nr:TolC family protein [Fibrobacteraceae bacterium]
SESLDFQKNTSDKFTDTGAWGIQIDIPLFDGFAAKAKASQARIEKQQLQLKQSKLRLNLKNQAEQAQRELQLAQHLVDRNINIVQLSKENFNMKQQEYEEQVCALSDLLSAENSVISARSELAKALYNEKSAELNLEYALGVISRQAE